MGVPERKKSENVAEEIVKKNFWKLITDYEPTDIKTSENS